MVIESARKAARQLTAPKFRSVLLKSVGLTILLFLGVWIGAEAAVSTFVTPALAGWPWIATAVIWLMGAGVLLGAGFLLAPVSAIFAGLFLDEVAEVVEKNNYPEDGVGTAVPIGRTIWLTLRFLFLVVIANLIALILVLVPGINFAIFFFVNGYLLGREYFTFAAMRFVSEKEANQLRQQNSTNVFLAGLIIAGFMAVPILNLATPVFAVALMVHLQKAISKRYSSQV